MAPPRRVTWAGNLTFAAVVMIEPCAAQQVGAPTPGAAPGGQFGPGAPQIPMTPAPPSRRELATPEPLPGTGELGTGLSGKSDFRSSIESGRRLTTPGSTGSSPAPGAGSGGLAGDAGAR